MKKFMSVILALTLLLMTACGGENGQTEQSIYEELSGIDPEKVVMTVDGNTIPAALYLYWTLTSATNTEYQIQLYNRYYGLYSDVLNADGSLKWDAQMLGDQTVTDYVSEQTRSTVSFYAAVENLAAEHGVSLTEADLAAIESYKTEVAASYHEQLIAQDSANESLSGEEVLDKYLELLGLSEPLFDRLSASSYLFDSLKALILTEGSALYLANEDYNQYGFYADHILLSTMDTTTGTAYEQSVIDEKRALAEDILAQLQASDDMETLFTQLADQYSEDPGHATNPTGYIYTPGTMVSEFEQAVEALEYGGLSGIVESSYGFHIILRRDLAQGLAAYPEQKDALAEEHLTSLINLSVQNAEIVVDEALSDFNAGEFYTAYMIRTAELANNTATDQVVLDK